MAQSRNPFDDSHIAAQLTPRKAPVATRHRDIERARQEVQKGGASPNRGNFRRVYPEPVTLKNGQVRWPSYDERTQSYVTPKGTEAVIVERAEPGSASYSHDPHTRRMRVNGKEYTVAAGTLLLQRKFGIDTYC